MNHAKIKLLLVEDDAMLRDLVSRRLEREGYQVLTAENGAEAIVHARSERPELILMDMGLPLLNGFQAAARLKMKPETCTIPIIALTAFAMTNDRAKCLAVGCDEYETKPIAFERLLSKIQTLLKQPSVVARPTTAADDELDGTMPRTDAPLPPAIVLVDDELDVRIILRRMLASLAEGYELITLGTGAAVLAEMAQRSVPLLVTDYNMQGITGLDLTQRVKAAAPTTTVVLVSAYATPILEQRAQAAGADYFLPKPFPFERLEAIVREALS